MDTHRAVTRRQLTASGSTGTLRGKKPLGSHRRVTYFTYFALHRRIQRCSWARPSKSKDNSNNNNRRVERCSWARPSTFRQGTRPATSIGQTWADSLSCVANVLSMCCQCVADVLLTCLYFQARNEEASDDHSVSALPHTQVPACVCLRAHRCGIGACAQVRHRCGISACAQVRLCATQCTCLNCNQSSL